MSKTARLLQALFITVLLLCGLYHSSLVLAADDAASLLRHYTTLKPQLNRNEFHRTMHLDSVELPSTIKGDIYAVVDYPFAPLQSALTDPAQGPDNWCDVLILHPNMKYCHAVSNGKGKMLNVNVGKKTAQPLAETDRMAFNYKVVAADQEYFHVDLDATNGPLDSRDYRIVLEAVAIDGKHTFLHLTYSYHYGAAGRTATSIYLATVGRNKVGFTSTGRQSNGQKQYIGGVRGVVERNAMRYYLAIDAYLSSLSLPADKQMEKRLSSWFGATEQYARQLHEVKRQDYMQMKHQEYQRQQTVR